MTLYELNSLVRETLEQAMPGDYWVTAELSELREVRGHCYMELVQKDPGGNTTVARASAKCWRNTWLTVSQHFARVTGQALVPGMKVMLKVYAQFHENYGFSWIVTGIDPVFTMGDMARRRREIIERLREEGVLELNKELVLPLFARRIAVISALTAAGYGDFRNQLEANAFGFSFEIRLFEAVMQGEMVEKSIIAALDRINESIDMFDCVVIIRGGGATSDLSGFDSFALAENVANFPIPVITGIGHERDETVLDVVAHTRVKTPTAAAALLIDNLKAVLDRIERSQERVVHAVEQRMKAEHLRMDRLSERIPVLFSLVKTHHFAAIDTLSARLDMAARAYIDTCRRRLDMLSSSLVPLAERRLMAERHHMELLSQRVSAADPALLLRRGYSITLCGGRIVRDAALLKAGDVIETRLDKGSVKSRVEQPLPNPSLGRGVRRRDIKHGKK